MACVYRLVTGRYFVVSRQWSVVTGLQERSFLQLDPGAFLPFPPFHQATLATLQLSKRHSWGSRQGSILKYCSIGPSVVWSAPRSPTQHPTVALRFWPCQPKFNDMPSWNRHICLLIVGPTSTQFQQQSSSYVVLVLGPFPSGFQISNQEPAPSGITTIFS